MIRELLAAYCHTRAQLFSWTHDFARELGCTVAGAPLPTIAGLLAAAPFDDDGATTA